MAFSSSTQSPLGPSTSLKGFLLSVLQALHLPQWSLDASSSVNSAAWTHLRDSSSCCEALSSALGPKVALPDTTPYLRSLTSYFSLKNSELHPSCVVFPESAEDVSQAVQILTLGDHVWSGRCNFAVRGGGHTTFKGAASIEDGAVINLANMPKRGLAEDKETITISPGQTWDQVYEVLDEQGLTTLGARVAGVGVGGAATGCAISYVSPRYGFTCDVVENFEVVLANGSIVNANASHHTSLWKSLRGGSNNFGVVTALTQKTFQQGQFWGGQTFHLASETRSAQFSALESLISSSPYDPYAHFICNLLISNATYGNWLIGDSLQYTKSSPSPEPFPEVFRPFTDLPRIALYPGGPDNTLRITNFTDISREYAALAFYPKRWLFATATFGNSAEMMNDFFAIANATIQPFLTLPGFALSIAYQPLPSIMTSRHGAVDALGPLQNGGDMFFIHWAMSVDDEAAEHDEAMRAATKKVMEKANLRAEELGVRRQWLALTYADSWQDPLGSYGEESVREMWEVSRAYDPERVFQRQVPGGFKLPMVAMEKGRVDLR
ncbi:MAG: hypothetical protein Q9160_003391 [Pyrenula sp. 1 TL-2023]